MCYQLRRQAWAWGLSPKMSLRPHGPHPPWNILVKNQNWILRDFYILFVSAVKICKQCLQTALASGGLHPWNLLGDFRPLNPMDYSPQMKISDAATVCLSIDPELWYFCLRLVVNRK